MYEQRTTVAVVNTWFIHIQSQFCVCIWVGHKSHIGGILAEYEYFHTTVCTATHAVKHVSPTDFAPPPKWGDKIRGLMQGSVKAGQCLCESRRTVYYLCRWSVKKWFWGKKGLSNRWWSDGSMDGECAPSPTEMDIDTPFPGSVGPSYNWELHCSIQANDHGCIVICLKLFSMVRTLFVGRQFEHGIISDSIESLNDVSMDSSPSSPV